LNRGDGVEINTRDLFSKRRKITVGVSGKKVCTTIWNFVTSDFSKHSIRLSHVQASYEVDAQGKCRRVVEVDGKEHYNKKSNSKYYIFNIAADEVRVSIHWENFSWNYRLAINGQDFQRASINV